MLAILLTLTLAQPVPEQTTRDRTFWVSLVDSRFAVPPGEDAFKLLVEMNALLGSPDPFLRDDVAYGAALTWIARKRLLSAEQQKALLALWSKNLDAGLGEDGTDSVLRRSFSALNLSILAAWDNEAPFLAAEEHDAFVARMLDYFARERDTRGYDATKGWMHTPAHTADALKFLARSGKLSRPRQAQLIDAVAAKCGAVGHAFAWGEDERIAQVVRSIVRRADFDRAPLTAWLTAAAAAHRELWAHAPAIDPSVFAKVDNTKRVLRAAYTALALDTDLSAAATAARDEILRTLARM